MSTLTPGNPQPTYVAGTTPQGDGCGKSVELMRRETEVFLTHIFKREIKINEPYKP